jgi:hypothetical protein
LSDSPTHSSQTFRLLQAFYSLHDASQSEIIGYLKQAAHHCHAGVVGRQIANEGLIDLDDVHGDVEQVSQGRKSGAEIVQCCAHSVDPERSYTGCDDIIALSHIGFFGHFEDEMLQGNLTGVECRLNTRQEIAEIKSVGSDVQTDMLNR